MAVILVIEDDICLRENTKEILELAGYSVLTAENGQKGIQLALSKRVDLILCDIIMPVLDGYAVLRELSSVPKTQKIPFIFLTAKSDLKEIRTGMNLGADDYIVKPFEEKELLESLRTRLEKAALLRRKKPVDVENEITEIRSLQDFKEYFLKSGEELSLYKKEDLFSENQFARNVYFLQKGLVKTYRIDEYGKELITGISRSGSFLGLYSLKENIAYPESAFAMETSRLFRLPLSLVLKVFHFNPQLTHQWAQELSEEVIELKNHLLQTAYASVLRKTINTILEFSEKMKFKKNELVKISRGDLANVAGISKESFIRSLSSLKNDGLINVDGRNIEILDLDELKKIRG